MQAWVGGIIRKCNVFRIIAFAVPIDAVGTDAGHGRGRQYSKLIGVAVLQKTAPQKSIPLVCSRYHKMAPGSSLELEDTKSW